MATINSFHILQIGKYSNWSCVCIGVLLAHAIEMC